MEFSYQVHFIPQCGPIKMSNNDDSFLSCGDIFIGPSCNRQKTCHFFTKTFQFSPESSSGPMMSSRTQVLRVKELPSYSHQVDATQISILIMVLHR
jgi:hypothetical protein